MRMIIAGVGPGERRYLTGEVQDAIAGATVVAGGKRHLEDLVPAGIRVREIHGHLETLSELLETLPEDATLTVLASGDPQLFGIADWLCRNFPQAEVTVLPGISSMQLFYARLKRPWQHVRFSSCHGRTLDELSGLLRHNQELALFTDAQNHPAVICRHLCRMGFSEAQVDVGEALGYPEERIVTGSACELSGLTFGPLSVMAVRVPAPEKIWQFGPAGIPDVYFTRGDIPMTKREIRAMIASVLCILPHHTLWDVGAGTGSVSIECALAASRGVVHAVECEPEGVRLITENARRFGVSNLIVHHGLAPDELLPLPRPDRVFIGGSKGNLGEIVHCALGKNPDVRICISAVTLETMAEAVRVLEEAGLDEPDILQIAATRTRKAGRSHLWQAQNPVTLITAQRGGLKP